MELANSLSLGSIVPEPKRLSTLINVGNSCYINVCIQVLGHTSPLRELFTTGLYKELFHNEPATLHTKFVTDYNNLMKGMYGDREDCIVQPITFRNTLITCVDQFSGYRQQDAHECLVFILHLLHCGLGVPVLLETASTEPGRNPTTAWANFLKHEKNSHILTWFYGQYESVKKCMNCNTVFPTYDAWNCLSLEIPLSLMKAEYSLNDLFTAHITAERLTDKYDCENCKAPHDAMTQHVIWKCPNILIIQMKRFRNGGKIVVPIDFPFELDLRPFVSNGNQNQSTVYDLYGVVYHQGQMNGGHYLAACKIKMQDWYAFNDEKQHPITPDRVVTPFAYVLFYRKRISGINGEFVPPLWNTWNE